MTTDRLAELLDAALADPANFGSLFKHNHRGVAAVLADVLREQGVTVAQPAECPFPHQFGDHGLPLCPVHQLCLAPVGTYDGVEGGRPWCVRPCPHGAAQPAPDLRAGCCPNCRRPMRCPDCD